MYLFYANNTEKITVFFVGPELPEDVTAVNAGHEIVSNDETLYACNTYTGVFYKLKCSKSIEDCHWEKLYIQLNYPRHKAVVLMLPEYMEHMVHCT